MKHSTLLVTEVYFSSHLFILSIEHLIILYHLKHSTCYIFLHQCIYTIQHVTGDGSFYFVCIQIQHLTLLYYCNTRLYGTSWPWKLVLMPFFWIFSLPCIYLLSPFINLLTDFQIAAIHAHSIIKPHFLYTKNISRHCISWVILRLFHVIAKCVLLCPDKQWFDHFTIYVIVQNISTFTVIVVSETTTFFSLIVSISVTCFFL